MKNTHVIFFDGGCPLCQRAVRGLLTLDSKEIFLFSPLQGKAAKRELKKFIVKNPSVDTLILLQNYQTKNQKIFIEGRAILRIAWLLGGKYAWIGWLSFFPSKPFDWIYRMIARRRYHFFSSEAPGLEHPENRFLP